LADQEANRSNRGWRRYFLPVLGVSALLLVLSLGYIGFGQNEELSRTDRIYASLELFALHGADFPLPVTLKYNICLELARFFAPLSEIIGFIWLYIGYSDTAAEFTDKIFFRLSPGNHIVICGLGQKGFQLVKDLGKSNRVVVIEKHPSNPNVEECRALGILVYIGDASTPEILKKARVQNAKRLIAISGNDGTNVDIAVQVGEFLSTQGKRRENPLECHVHIVDLELRSLFRFHQTMPTTQKGVRVSMFNVFENGARMLFQNVFLDYGPRPIVDPNDVRQAHLIVLGFGHVGESVVLQAVKMTHFPNGKKVRLTIVDKDAARQYDRFRVRYGAFPEHCAVDPPLDAFADESRVFEQIEGWCKDPNSIVTVVVCFEDDARSLSVGLSLLAKLKGFPVLILVRIESQAGLARLVARAADHPDFNNRMLAFGQIEEACSAEVVIQEKLDEFARAIHEAFRTKRKGDKRPAEDFSMAEWSDLDPDLKESNRQQADHIRFKLRAMNWVSQEDPRIPSVSKISTSIVETITDEGELEKLAEMEHNRWWAERALAGWQQDKRDKKVRDIRNRLHTDMKPWKELTPDVRNYDLEAVRLLPQLVAAFKDQIIYRLPKNGS
jgi:hypothetical protein